MARLNHSVVDSSLDRIYVEGEEKSGRLVSGVSIEVSLSLGIKIAILLGWLTFRIASLTWDDGAINVLKGCSNLHGHPGWWRMFFNLYHYHHHWVKGRSTGRVKTSSKRWPWSKKVIIFLWTFVQAYFTACRKYRYSIGFKSNMVRISCHYEVIKPKQSKNKATALFQNLLALAQFFGYKPYSCHRG